MSLHLPSGSGHDRSLACPASCAMAAVETPNEWAEGGTKIHDFIRRALMIGREPALMEIDRRDDMISTLEYIPVDELPKGGRYEVALAWNWRTDEARILGENINRDYARFNLSPDEFVMTLDVVGTADGGNLIVIIDWKSGYSVLPPPGRAAQLLSGALAASRVLNIYDADVSFGIIHPDEEDPAERFRRVNARVDALQLDAHADRLRDLVPRIAENREKVRLRIMPDVVEGPHCKYCPAWDACPAKTAIARELSQNPKAVEDRLERLADEDQGKAFALLDTIKKIYERGNSTMRDRARTRPIPLPNGKWLKEVPWPVTEWDPGTVFQVVKELVGPEAATKALETTKAAIERAVRASGKDVKLVLSEIEARGGLVRGKKPQVRQVEEKERRAS